MESEYGDTLKLERGTDFTLETSKTKTIIEVNYTYWANAPVYTKLKVDVDSDKLNWDARQYKISKLSHSYDIASVYGYKGMAGGPYLTSILTVRYATIQKLIMVALLMKLTRRLLMPPVMSRLL